MPVDDLLLWAADKSHCGPRRPSTNNPKPSAGEPHSRTELRSTTNRSPSPSPKHNRLLPRWFEIGHCAAACSGRCCLHATEEKQQDGMTEANASLRGVAEALQTQRRSHRPSFQRIDNQNVRLVSSPKPKRSDGEYRNPRLELARQALLNGNTTIASAIVAEEMERLGEVEKG